MSISFLSFVWKWDIAMRSLVLELLSIVLCPLCLNLVRILIGYHIGFPIYRVHQSCRFEIGCVQYSAVGLPYVSVHRQAPAPLELD